MSLFERWLSLWVALCILAGLVLGNFMPGLFAALAGLEYASVNLVVAVLIWAMVYPMMVGVDPRSLSEQGEPDWLTLAARLSPESGARQPELADASIV